MLPVPSSTESGMSAQLYAAVQRAQQQCPAQGGWEPMAWKKQLLPPPQIHQSLGVVLNDLHHHAERENKQKPKAKPPT
jgi:hypothetical protein